MTAIAMVAMITNTSAQTASDHYLDMANYATIGAGDQTKIDNIYKYTEVSNSSYAWVTMSVYGTVYGGGKSNWLETSNKSKVELSSIRRDWNASNPFLGKSAYFINTPPRVFGWSTSQNKNDRVVTFYVTNITGVSLWGTNYNNYDGKASKITIFECTKNADGTLTPSNTSTYTNSTTSIKDEFKFECSTLEKTKYYKVVCSTIYGLFYEIAFRLPLPEYIDVTISSALYSTFYWDFPAIIPEDEDLFNVLYPTEISGKSLVLKPISGSIPAKTGVILFGNAGTYRFYRNTGTVTPLAYTNLLSGSSTKITRAKALELAGKTEDNAIIMTLAPGKEAAIGFYKYTGSTLAANKAFLIYDTTSNSNVSYLSIGGGGGEDLDGIRDVKNIGTDDAWYTLQGARLNGTPTQRGIYIHGGKKVAVK